ncbi:MAG: type IVB secretion system protein IcmH/DotU [Candidatus Thiodiazotropha sp.]
MSVDDPTKYRPGKGDRTVVRPLPGGRRPRAGEVPRQAVQPTELPLNRYSNAPSSGRTATTNWLAEMAANLLSLVSQLRETVSHHNVEELRVNTIREVKAFEDAAHRSGIDAETKVTARYLLCTLVDETVLSTPWGSQSPWGEQTLLSIFHKETWGGEKFFRILEHLRQEPAVHIDLLELVYLCLALGFQGKYRVEERGQGALESVQDNLYRTIRSIRGEFERDLSLHWRGLTDRRNPLVRYVPLWALGAVLSVIVLGIFIGFRVSLNQETEPVYQRLARVGQETPAMPEIEITEPQAVETLTLRKLLASDILAGLVSVTEQDNKSDVVIKGDGLFDSSSTRVKEDYKPLLQRIANALKQLPGQVLVIGHTDNVPIRSLRFRSNWDLSRQRAVAVAQMLAGMSGSAERYFAEGKADTEPLATNDSAIGRARNRRVEIVLYKNRADL